MNSSNLAISKIFSLKLRCVIHTGSCKGNSKKKVLKKYNQVRKQKKIIYGSSASHAS